MEDNQKEVFGFDTAALDSDRVPELDHIRESHGRAVFRALANPQCDFRTVGSIARETGLAPRLVRDLLTEYDYLIRVSPRPDPLGRQLFTLRSKPLTPIEKFAHLRMAYTRPLK